MGSGYLPKPKLHGGRGLTTLSWHLAASDSLSGCETDSMFPFKA
jgi:hypothetical protein